MIHLANIDWMTVLKEQGAVVASLLAGLYVLWKALSVLVDKLITGLQTQNSALTTALQKEREEHVTLLRDNIDQLQKRVDRLEQKSDECERDRVRLHELLRASQ